jgi:DNA polymerase III delta prime subunit
MVECFLNKYAPKTFQDFSIDNYTILNNSDVNILINGTFSTGKTTLLFKFIQNYFNDNINIYDNPNILFINNLKDQGIQFCRNNVKTFCQTASSNLNKKKIIAIDDIDEFSDVSQQVIANCLNKYGNNVICIASCINTLKVFNGLKSRMIFITIYSPTYDKLLDITSNIITNENIDIDSDLIPLLIHSSNSSYKILLNTLQKIKIFNCKVDKNNIYELITSINFKNFNLYIQHIKDLNLIEAINILDSITNSGVSVIDILFEFFYYIKISNIINDDMLKYNIIQIISKYIIIFNNLHEDSIELAFFTNEILYLFNS